jgi:DNA gyrase/topoisomerase IV subunit A
MSNLPSRTAEDFFDKEYRNYALYTITSRAIPSLVDGFKPAQRKIAFAANKLWKTGNEKPMKVFQLGGQAAALSFFHHGSLDDTIIGMTQEFKNSLPIFQGIGQFGTLRSPVAGAPRYVGVKFNENFRLLYKDFELVEPQFEEGEEIEPRFFLPIIPTVLLNGGSGIAVGFATNILNRHPLDLIDATVDLLERGDTQNLLKPWVNGFWGEVTPGENPRNWKFSGSFSVKSGKLVEVTEVPPGFTYEKYEQHLDSLVERGYLQGYDDQSSDRIRYGLKFFKDKLSALLAEDKLESLLKMVESATENITVLDEQGNLKVFPSALDLLTHFVEVRLGYYEKRKEYQLKKLSEEIEVLAARVEFVRAVVAGEIPLGNLKKEELLALLAEKGFPKIEGSWDYLLSMSILSLTPEKHRDLQDRLAAKQGEKKKVEETTPKDMYLGDLRELRKKLSGKSAPLPEKKEASSSEPQSNFVQGWIGEGTQKKGEDWLSFLLGASEKAPKKK